ncbi:hypothetical protein [endosymbiont of Sipalinus gigas]|uniref:hypothetical protein n=1 Tax=endosymbiont of Sipalinus gigas TaxID=1972134 RepID=UPI001E3037BB|nr:hypothetical protein [endosymbiont of Sipalinus gigas]
MDFYEPGLAYCLDLINKKKIDNIKIINYDINEIIKKLAPKNFIYKIIILFPDPWEKKKHNKRRIINNEFLLNSYYLLKKNTILNIVTDSEIYKNFILNIIIDSKLFILKNEFIYKNSKYFTKFENKAVKSSKMIWDMKFYKK